MMVSLTISCLPKSVSVAIDSFTCGQLLRHSTTHHSVHNTLYTRHSLQHSAHNTLYTRHSPQHSVHSLWHSAYMNAKQYQNNRIHSGQTTALLPSRLSGCYWVKPDRSFPPISRALLKARNRQTLDDFPIVTHIALVTLGTNPREECTYSTD